MRTTEDQQIGLLCQWKKGQDQSERHCLRADAAIHFTALHQTCCGKLSQRAAVIARYLGTRDSMRLQQIIQQSAAACAWLAVRDVHVLAYQILNTGNVFGIPLCDNQPFFPHCVGKNRD